MLVEDLSPGERVVLSAKFADEWGQEWSSTAIFEADDEGRVGTSEQAPVQGSYRVEDPMGLVWSALGSGGLYVPSPQPSPVTVTAEVGGERVRVEVERYAMADGVEATDVREGGLVGRVFLPAGARPAPGVLVLGGSEGGLAPFVAREAALLASEGFAALALAYFAGDYPGTEELHNDLPEKLVEIPLEYFGRAMGWLSEQEAVQGDGLGAVGHSRGGELALLLGANYQEIKAVVSYVGSGVVAPSPEGDEPAWTFRGEPLPRLPYVTDASEVSEEELKEAEIPVEHIDGPVLLIAAGDDKLWPSARLSRIAMERLTRRDRPYRDKLVVYPNAGHLIQALYVPAASGIARFGGDPKSNAEANENSWQRTLGLLGERLKR